MGAGVYVAFPADGGLGEAKRPSRWSWRDGRLFSAEAGDVQRSSIGR